MPTTASPPLPPSSSDSSTARDHDHLLATELSRLNPPATPSSSTSKGHPATVTTTEYQYHDDPPAHGGASSSSPIWPSASNNQLRSHSRPQPQTAITNRLYKRRFLGLAQLILLNVIVSWSWLTFAPVSETAATYFDVSIPTVNWLSTGFLFAFVAATPAVMWTLNHLGPKGAIVISSSLIAVGSWIRYAGTRANNSGDGGRGLFGVVVFGQVLIGLAQPFVLAAPTRYSEMWFSETGRISATAAMSLANPFGGAVGQLVDPFWATKPEDIPSLVLYVSIISTAATLPSLFLPSRPPTPPTPQTPHQPPRLTLSTLRALARNPSFHLLALPFIIYVSAFNATSSLLVPILTPFAFSETTAGIAGALLIVVGLVSAAVTSPILDRHPSWRIPCIKLLVPVIAAMYLSLVFVPSSGSAPGVYVIMAVLGAASFTLVPLALEMMVEVTWPEVGAEVSSCLAWAAGQLGGGLFIVVMDALGEGARGKVPGGLVWQAVWAVGVLPVPLCLGFWGTGRSKRGEVGVVEAGGGNDTTAASATV